MRTFFCLAAIGLLTTIGSRYWNRTTRLNRSLAASSYDIYLLHLPIVVILQFAFLTATLPMVIKFVIIFVTAVAVSWSLSASLVRPYPKLSSAALLAAFVLTGLVVVP